MVVVVELNVAEVGRTPPNQPCEDVQAESWWCWWWWLNSMLLKLGGHPQINPVRTARRVVVVVVELNVAEVGWTFRPNQPREEVQAQSWWCLLNRTRHSPSMSWEHSRHLRDASARRQHRRPAAPKTGRILVRDALCRDGGSGKGAMRQIDGTSSCRGSRRPPGLVARLRGRETSCLPCSALRGRP